MTDIVERLREFAAYGDTGEGRILAQLALTEIKRLRTNVEYWRLAAERRDARKELTGLDVPEARTIDAPEAPRCEVQSREAVIEECARELETSYPDHAWLNAACAAIRSLGTHSSAQTIGKPDSVRGQDIKDAITALEQIKALTPTQLLSAGPIADAALRSIAAAPSAQEASDSGAEIKRLRAQVEYWRLAAERREARMERSGVDVAEASTLDAPSMPSASCEAPHGS